MKFGVPNTIISLLKVLHANFIVKFTVDDNTQSVDCIIGVKKGDTLGPMLFIFFIAAMLITWKASCNIPACMFQSRIGATLPGRGHWAYGESFSILDSEYTDDTAIIFQSRANVSDRNSSIILHFGHFGTEIHAGLIHPKQEPKTEILLC